jgi:hypothetical protein
MFTLFCNFCKIVKFMNLSSVFAISYFIDYSKIPCFFETSVYQSVCVARHVNHSIRRSS